MVADEELVREWQQGSAGALEALVQRHHAPLLAHLARLTGDAHLAGRCSSAGGQSCLT